jgi:metal-responsive CopG/Arc/MetJ family transcriptional regulator
MSPQKPGRVAAKRGEANVDTTITIGVSNHLLDQINDRVDQLGVSRSEFIRDAVIRKLAMTGGVHHVMKQESRGD